MTEKKNTQKGNSYSYAFSQMNRGIEQGFYIETIAIAESIIADRLQSYAMANGWQPKRDFTPFGEFITQADKLYHSNTKNDKIALFGDLKIWKDEYRNKVIHQVAKSDPGEATIDLDEFLQLAKEGATLGYKYARMVCDWHRKEKLIYAKYTLKFWQDFINFMATNGITIELNKKTLPPTDKVDGTGNWLQVKKSKKPWFAFIIKTTESPISCGFTVDEECYDILKSKKSEFEQQLGFTLAFKKLDNDKENKLCRIFREYDKTFATEKEHFQWYLDSTQRFIDVFKQDIPCLDDKTIINRNE
jgi:uncharacterized protein DUF4268